MTLLTRNITGQFMDKAKRFSPHHYEKISKYQKLNYLN